MLKIDPQLLSDVKADQGVTWSDPQTDSRFRTHILNGMAYIDKRLGEAGDYMAPGDARMLLFEYVRYARAGALDVFEKNYQHIILDAQNDRRIARYAKEHQTAAVQAPE